MRIVTSAAAGRPTFYDRNPAPKSNLYSAGAVVPHGSTTRWSYTVPAGKKAWVDALFLAVDRAAAAAPAGTIAANINYVPNGGATAVLGQALLINNTVGAMDKLSVTQFGYLGAGDVISATTVDTSTGGSADLTAGAKYTEYDA